MPGRNSTADPKLEGGEECPKEEFEGGKAYRLTRSGKRKLVLDREDLQEELETGHEPSTCFGGFMSFLGLVMLIYEFVGVWQKIYSIRKNTYTPNKHFWLEKEMNELDYITLGRFNTSANFVFGLNGEDLEHPGFDILNNQYVEFVGIQMERGNHKIELNNRYAIDRCSEEQISRFIPEYAQS